MSCSSRTACALTIAVRFNEILYDLAVEHPLVHPCSQVCRAVLSFFGHGTTPSWHLANMARRRPSRVEVISSPDRRTRLASSHLSIHKLTMLVTNVILALVAVTTPALAVNEHCAFYYGSQLQTGKCD